MYHFSILILLFKFLSKYSRVKDSVAITISFAMPNITYLKLNRFSARLFTNTSNSPTYPDDVILLIEEQNMDGHHFKNMTSIAVMILAWGLMLVGFILCCCAQFCKRSKTSNAAAVVSTPMEDGSQACCQCSTRNNNTIGTIGK